MPKDIRGNGGELGSASRARGAGHTRGSAANLSREARVKGGQRSAQVQVRDERGQFAGRIGGGSRGQQRRAGQPQQQSQGQTENR